MNTARDHLGTKEGRREYASEVAKSLGVDRDRRGSVVSLAFRQVGPVLMPIERRLSAARHDRSRSAITRQEYAAVSDECISGILEAIDGAIGAYDRHANTDYDALLASGMDRDAARSEMRRMPAM